MSETTYIKFQMPDDDKDLDIASCKCGKSWERTSFTHCPRCKQKTIESYSWRCDKLVQKAFEKRIEKLAEEVAEKCLEAAGKEKKSYAFDVEHLRESEIQVLCFILSRPPYSFRAKYFVVEDSESCSTAEYIEVFWR